MPPPITIPNTPLVDPQRPMYVSREWLAYFNALSYYMGPSGGLAPADAGYVVDAANATLTAERVATSSTSVTVSTAVAGQMSWLRAALTGDVTASSNANATTIANDAVTYAKMQNVSAASRFLGRGSAAGAGDVEELAPDGTTITISGTTVSAVSGGAGINQLTGDVTAGPGVGSQAATIPNGTVTYAKMQDVSAASRLLGRGSAAGSGDVEEITLGTGLSMSGTALSASSGVATRGVGIVVNEGAVPSTGFKGESYIPYACTITAVTLIADAAGDVEFDIFAVAYGSYTAPGDGSSIVASAPPTLSGAIKSQDTTLTGWTTSIAAGTVVSYEITGTPSTLTRVQLLLTVTV